MMLTGFETESTFEHFGRNSHRDHDLCPHCGKRGNKQDTSTLLWNERPMATDHEYQCATCKGEWLIRHYHQTGYEKYPSAPYAVIYIPSADK